MAIAQLQFDESHLMSRIASACRLDAAFNWLCKNKQKVCPNDLVWGLTWNWQPIKATLRSRLQRGYYIINPLKTIQLPDGMLVSIWHSLDVIVINALTKVIVLLFKVNLDLSGITHLKGNGGLKQVCQKVRVKLKTNCFGCKTDTTDFHASMQYDVLIGQLRSKIKDNCIVRLFQEIMNRVHMCHGTHRLIENKSIPLSCLLSPWLPAIYLLSLNVWAREHKIDYVRYYE